MEIIHADGVGLKFHRHRRRRTLRGAFSGGHSARKGRDPWFWALRGVNFTVRRGETLGVIGRNGSGKSTLLRLLGGIYCPDEGQLRVSGSVSTLLSVTAGFRSELTGTENVYLNAALMGFSRSDVDPVLQSIMDFSELGDFVQAPVKTYSSGMTARLGFSIAVHLKRDIMLVDEVLGVGDASFKEKSARELRQVMSEDRTVILTSHSMDSIRSLATHVLWLDKGNVMAYGDPQTTVGAYLEAQRQPS
jgi:ABC-type polysaccharide/polyol phosphate transport system ATPase subunit